MNQVSGLKEFWLQITPQCPSVGRDIMAPLSLILGWGKVRSAAGCLLQLTAELEASLWDPCASSNRLENDLSRQIPELTRLSTQRGRGPCLSRSLPYS